jgi:hypothetical protein
MDYKTGAVCVTVGGTAHIQANVTVTLQMASAQQVNHEKALKEKSE